MRERIQEFIDQKYKGSLRFLKDKLFIKTFGQINYKSVIDYTNFLDPSQPFSHRVYCYLNNISSIPKCKTCKNNTNYNTNTGYQIYCSNTCRFADNDTIQNKKRKTNLEKYGSTNVLASKHGKDLSTVTHLKKYGETHYNKTQSYKNRLESGDIIRNPNPEKAALTHKTNAYNTIITKYTDLELLSPKEEYLEFGASTYHDYKWRCVACNTIFMRWLNMGWKPECPTCIPKGTEPERLIKDFLTHNNIQYTFRDRKSLGNRQEIDIYIPDKKIGIEYHGLYYHHDKVVDKYYHYNKMVQAESQGIRLIQIFGDEIFNSEKIVFSRLKHILGLGKYSIYARKCSVVELSVIQKVKFFNKYHIQGNGNGSIHLGLMYRNRLVAAMEFCKMRPGIGRDTKKDGFELMRYATIANFTIVGGAGKLFKHFIRTYKPNMVISFADRRWSQGDLYFKLGFKCISNKKNIGYSYTKNFKRRLHRIGFQSRLLRHKLEIYNEKLSEYENMSNNGFYRIYDCGNLKFEWDKPQN